MEEIWKDVKGYEGLYQISNLGSVKGLHSNIILKQEVTNRGYLRVNLSKQKQMKHHSTHRLLAIAFIPNPLNLPEVNHKDGIKLNTYESNLEWCTSSFNKLHAISMGLYKFKKINRHTKKGVYIDSFNTIKDASILLNLKHMTHISACAYNKRKSAYGYIWKFQD